MLRQTWLDKCLKSRVLGDPFTDNMANGLKHCCNVNGSIVPCLIVTVKVTALGKTSFSDIQNRKALC